MSPASASAIRSERGESNAGSPELCAPERGPLPEAAALALPERFSGRLSRPETPAPAPPRGLRAWSTSHRRPSGSPARRGCFPGRLWPPWKTIGAAGGGARRRTKIHRHVPPHPKTTEPATPAPSPAARPAIPGRPPSAWSGMTWGSSLFQGRRQDFGDTYAKVVVEDQNLSARDQPAVDQNIHRVSGQLVQRHDRAFAKFEDIVDEQFRASQFDPQIE